jgi:hypothetical protein
LVSISQLALDQVAVNFEGNVVFGVAHAPLSQNKVRLRSGIGGSAEPYSRFSTLGSTTVPSGSTTTKYIWRIGPLTVSENDTSQNGIGVDLNSWVSSAPTWIPKNWS